MRAKSRKCHWNPPCFEKLPLSMGKRGRTSTYACIVEADESTRTRTGTTEPRYHEDLKAVKGFNSLRHCNLVHKPTLILHAMKFLDAKAAVDKECEKIEKLPA